MKENPLYIDNQEIRTFVIGLLSWYDVHKRSLPWRGERNPYKIWLSEVILQQTRIDQGMGYYFDFINQFPTVIDLAQANEDTVLKAWEGLGYYSRARNLHRAAKLIAYERDGIFPTSQKDLLELPGVGDYTSAAIASICFDESVVVVDGNVNRLIARHFLVEEELQSAIAKKRIKTIGQTLIEQADSPGRFNQALMDFGSMQCRPQNPDCEQCPMQDSCLALRFDQVEALPRKKKKKPLRDRHLHYRIPICNGKTLIRKRSEKDIWLGLFDFPLEDSFHPDRESCAFSSKAFFADEMVHILSHQRLHIQVELYREPQLPFASQYDAIPLNSLQAFALPKPLRLFIDKHIDKFGME